MEFIAVILTLLCVILTIRSNVLCWPVSILSSIAYMYVFGEQHIYFQVILQVIFIIQSIYGWFYWNVNREIRMLDETWLNAAIHLTIILLLTVILSVSLQGKTDNPQLTLDILTSLLSLLGTWYLARRNVFAWLVWVVADMFFIMMFIDQHMYWSVALYLILLGLSIKGLIQWGKNMTTA